MICYIGVDGAATVIGLKSHNRERETRFSPPSLNRGKAAMELLPTCTLDDCPTGLFLFEGGGYGTLGFKSEYATPKQENGTTVGLQCDAYVVSSGEYFWGGVSDWRARSQLLVTPLNLDDANSGFWRPFAYLPEPDDE